MNEKLYHLIDSRGGMLCSNAKTNILSEVDENWERFVLLSSTSAKEICHHANIGDYGDDCVVADQDGVIMWEWVITTIKWKVPK